MQPLGNRFRSVATGVLALALLAVPVTAGADDDDPIVPGSCTPDGTHIVAPGCPDALTSEVRDPRPTLPNLVPDVGFVHVLRPVVFDPATGTFVTGELHLYFDTHSRNLGEVALDLVADDPQNPIASTVSQCVAWSYDLVCRERRRVGGFTFHAEHAHFHYEDFARYEFRRLTADGAVDESDAGLVARSDKVSFCLIDVAKAREDAIPVPTYAACNPVRQGISPGWSDIYTMDLPGQSLAIPVPDGRYALVITLDTANRLAEANDADNRVEAILELSGDGARVEVVERRFSS